MDEDGGLGNSGCDAPSSAERRILERAGRRCPHGNHAAASATGGVDGVCGGRRNRVRLGIDGVLLDIVDAHTA